jgi:23S rRNA pseudouridine1911/1915/1917 synthase
MPHARLEIPSTFIGSLRLDRYVAEVAALLGRSCVKSRNLQACVNGKSVKISRQVHAGDVLELSWEDPPASLLVPQDIPLTLLYKDARVLVIEKEQGMLVHPGAGNPDGTIANALLYMRQQSAAAPASAPSSATPSLRPGIVHRLDKDTSGLLIAALDDEAQEFLAAQFRDRSTKKSYLAICRGAPANNSGRIESKLGRDPKNRQRFTVVEKGGKHAVTLYKVLRRYQGYTLLMLRLITGRTHQIRVHLKHLGCPILGDPIYAQRDARFPEASLMLHAWRLRIRLPDGVVCGTADTRGRSCFTSSMPPRFKAVLATLEKK